MSLPGLERFHRPSERMSNANKLRDQGWTPRRMPDVDPAAGDLEQRPIDDRDGRPLLIWARTPSDQEPSPVHAEPDGLRDLPPPALVLQDAHDLGDAIKQAVAADLPLRGLRLSQPRYGRRWGAIHLPPGTDLSGSCLDRLTIGSPRGVTRRVSFAGCDMQGVMLRGMFESCDFTGATLNDAALRLATFRGCGFRGAWATVSFQGRVAFRGGSGDLTAGGTFHVTAEHPADPAEIGAAYPGLFQAYRFRLSQAESRRQHRRWWWGHLKGKLLGRPPIVRWPYPEEAELGGSRPGVEFN